MFERNLLSYSSAAELIRQGHWTLLTGTYETAKRAPADHAQEQSRRYCQGGFLTKSLKNAYFSVQKVYEEDLVAWTANPKVFAFCGAMRFKDELQKSVKIWHVDGIVKLANKACKIQEMKSDKIRTALLGKGKASTPFPLGGRILARKTKEMERILESNLR